MTVNTLGSHHDTRTSRTVAEWLWPFVPMGIAAFSLSALVYYHLWQNVFAVSSPLQQFYAWLYRVFGFAPAVMFFGLTILWSTIWLASGRVERPAMRFLRLSAMAVMLGIFLNLGDGGVSPSPQKGAIGAWFAETLVAAVGYWPSLLLVWAMTFASLLLATDFFFHESFERLRVAPAPGEAGVEAAVTDHLRGLGSVTSAVAGRAPAAVSPGNPAPLDSPGLSVASPVAGEPSAPAAGATTEPEAVEAPRRRSYEERRAARAWRREQQEEEWLPPPAPESQEIDDPEARAAMTSTQDVVAQDVDTQDVDAQQGDAASPVVSDPVEAELGDGSAEPSLPTAAAEQELADEPAIVLPGPPPEVLVWPDELPTAPVVGVRADEVAELVAAVDGGDEASAPSHEPAAEAEPVVPIPRPEPAAAPAADESAGAVARQQGLFGAQVDEALLQEAVDLVTDSRRASVTFLQRKLRIDYATASELLVALAARGIVALEGDATQGRVLG